MLCVQGGGACHLECGGGFTEAAWILPGREAVEPGTYRTYRTYRAPGYWLQQELSYLPYDM